MMEKVLILIDAANVSASCGAIGKKIDWIKFARYFDERYQVLRIKFYTAILEEDNGQQRLRPLVDFLQYNGFSVVSKPAKTYKTPTGEIKIKGNMDTEIVTDMLSTGRTVDHVILFSGDNDFCYAINALQQYGIRVSVVSTLRSSKDNGAVVGDELRKQADQFIDLEKLIADFERT